MSQPYPPASRRIFPFVIGGQHFYVDPLHTLRLLKLACGGKLTALTKAHNTYQGFADDGEPCAPAPEGSPEYMAGLMARGQIAAATIQAFGLTPFDHRTGQGTLEEDAISLYVAFTTFLNEKKASGGK